MNFFEKRRWNKMVAQLRHDARHVKNMRGDIATAEQLADLDTAERTLVDAFDRRSAADLEKASERLNGAVAAIYPAVRFPRMRENVEVIVVALAVAMAFRTYFIQPFKIPTGSMQPTLYGITVLTQAGRGVMDRFPLNLVSLALFGERYVEVRAAASGEVQVYGEMYNRDEDSEVFLIGGIPHLVRNGMQKHFEGHAVVRKGDILATGRFVYGDHIFVDKVRYNFCKPKRGDIVVFSTDHIDYPEIRPHSFYIKRMVGLPGEEVAIDPPYLLINGKRVLEPYPFERLLNDTDAAGYSGYVLGQPRMHAPTYLLRRTDRRLLKEGQYLVLGDNTRFSLDGRYFGPVTRDSLVGPAFMVYWPFSKRFGKVR